MSRLVRVSLLAVVLGLGGCGGCNDNNGVGRLPDASPPPDAMPPDEVSLAVINQGVPAIGVPVYFLDADGSLASATVTDDSGSASAVVTAGGSVTAIRPFTTRPAPTATAIGDGDELRTFLAVKPGDHLVLSRAATDSVTVVFDGAAPDGGNSDTSYQLVSTCGDGIHTLSPGSSSNGSESPDPGATLDLAGCHGAADIAVVASGGGLDGPLSLFHAGASVPPGPPVPVNLRGDAYTDASLVTFSYASAPDAPIDVLHWPIVTKGPLGPYAATVAAGTTEVTAGTTEVTIPEATVPATMEVIDSSFQVNLNRHEVIDWGPYAKDYAVDLSPSDVLLRESIDGPTFDIPTRKLAWTEATAGATPDLSVAAIQVTRGDATWRWEIAAPYSSSGIAFPQLPADAATWVPTTGDAASADVISQVKVTGGYNAVRAHIFDINDDLGPTGYVIGSGGRAVIVRFPVSPPGVRSRR
jgi:hypothetical protein